MKLARENDVFAVEVDNEFDRVKQLLDKKKKLNDKVHQIENEKDKYTDLELRKNKKNIKKEKQ